MGSRFGRPKTHCTGDFVRTLHRYNYVENSPINYTDPEGLELPPLGADPGAYWGPEATVRPYVGPTPARFARIMLKSVGTFHGGAALCDLGISIYYGELSFEGDVNNPPLMPPIGGLGPQTSPHWKQSGRQRHHVIQDAAVRELPGYSYSKAPTVGLPGQAKVAGTPHNLATVIQRQRGGGTLAAECRIGYKALRNSQMFSKEQARAAIQEAMDYFSSLGHGPTTPTRIPGDRR